MSLEILKTLVESSCASGDITEAEYTYLKKRAVESNVSEDDLNFLINSEIKKKQSKGEWESSANIEDISSGFLTSYGQNEMASGFLVEDQQTFPKHEESQIKIEFTDVSTLNSQGAMSVVEQGKYLGKWVIIKRLKPEFKHQQQYNDLFHKEFENGYHLDHVNIARILGKGQDSRGQFYFMEYVDGRPLSEIIRNHQITPELAKKIALELLDALEYIHKKQIYHRDLKPENIMVTFKGDNVKIIDFGLAAADSFDDHLVKVGTPAYAAPEQKTRGNTVDQRADIYSFGLIMLEMLTGSTYAYNASQVRDPLFREIIDKATQENPDNRYNTVREIIDQINFSSQVQFQQQQRNIQHQAPPIPTLNQAPPIPVSKPKTAQTHTGELTPQKIRQLEDEAMAHIKSKQFGLAAGILERLLEHAPTNEAYKGNLRYCQRHISHQQQNTISPQRTPPILQKNETQNHKQWPTPPKNQRPYNQNFVADGIKVNEYGNTSGLGKDSVVPPEIKGWNWGAFFFQWVWGLANASYLTFIVFVPVLNWVWVFVNGAKGNEWAWRGKKWESIEHFKRTQKIWSRIAWAIVLFVLFVAIVAGG